MRLWLGLGMLCMAIVLGTVPVQVMSALADTRTSELAAVSSDPAGDHDHGQHHHGHHCGNLIGMAGCSSWAPALAATSNWQLLRPSWTFRYPTDTYLRDSIALAPPKRPPRLT